MDTKQKKARESPKIGSLFDVPGNTKHKQELEKFTLQQEFKNPFSTESADVIKNPFQTSSDKPQNPFMPKENDAVKNPFMTGKSLFDQPMSLKNMTTTSNWQAPKEDSDGEEEDGVKPSDELQTMKSSDDSKKFQS